MKTTVGHKACEMGKKILDVNRSPGFEIECYHNVRLSIILKSKDNFPWFHGNFVNLQVKAPINNEFPIVQFEDHLNIYSEVLHEEKINFNNDWVEQIKSCILNNEYVVLFLDWSKVPDSHYYQNRSNVIHEALVYGYDDETKRFLLLGFEIKGQKYGSFTISYEDLVKHIEDVIKYTKVNQKWYAYFGYPVSRIKENKNQNINFNIRNLYFSLNRSKSNSLPDLENGIAMGNFVPLFFGHYFKSLSNSFALSENEYEVWNIMLYKILLHNKLMRERLVFLQSIYGQDPLLDRVIDFYARSRKELILIISESNKFIKLKEKQLLRSISERFMKCHEYEKRAFPLLMEYLVQLNMNNNLKY